MKRIIYFIILPFIIYSCEKSPEKKRVLDLNFDIKNDCSLLDLSEHFNCNLIVLKTSSNDSVMIGKIDKVIVNDSLLYMSDSQFGRRVFVYDFYGNFKYTIGALGKGPGEYVKLSDFDLFDNHIFILSGPDRKIIKFDLLGRYIDEVQLSDHGGFALKCLPNNKFFTLRTLGLTGTRIFNERGKVIKETLIEGYEFCSFTTKKAISSCENKTICSTMYNDTIYELDEQGNISPLFYMDFKDKTFPISKISNKDELMKAKRNTSYIWSEWIVNNDKCILIKYVKDGVVCIGYYIKNKDNFISFYNKFNGIPLLDLNGQYRDQIIFSTESFYVKKIVSERKDAPEILRNLSGYESPVLFFLKPKDL